MEGSFRLLFAETNLQTRETSRSPPIRENIRKGIIYLWKFRCVEREIMDHAWSNSFLFLEKKNFNVSRSMFRIYFRKFVVYNGYKCYDDRKINSRRVASYSNIYLRNLNINRRNACLLPLDRWYLYVSTHLFQICTVVRAKQIFLLLLNFEIHFSNQILPFKSGRKSVDSNIFSNIQLRSIWGGERGKGERKDTSLLRRCATTLILF